MWLEPTPWDIAQREQTEQNSFASIVMNAIENGGAPKVDDDVVPLQM